MGFDRFRVAMRNKLRRGPYDLPFITSPAVTEWLVVERFGQDGRYLWVSDASPNTETPNGEAPNDLTIGNTLFAVLTDEDADRQVAEFLFVRHLPRNGSTEGIFFPADGHARIQQGDTGLVLTASGRNAHSRGELNGIPQLNDIPNPAPGEASGINWHFDAAQRPWAQNMV